MRLLLGIPTAGSPAAPFLKALESVEFPSGTALDRYVVTGNFVPAQRELIAERALAVSADVLVMCDDDVVIPSDGILALLALLEAEPRCGLAGALYYSRDGFRPMAVDGWDPSDTTRATIPAFANAPVAVDGVGFGCIALRTSALAELEPLYFGTHIFLEPEAGRVRVCDEDYLFCHRLREKGWKVMLHAGVRCGHYDRGRGRIMPDAWEPASVTDRRRIAARRGDEHLLLPYDDIPSPGEYHRRAFVEYITPKG